MALCSVLPTWLGSAEPWAGYVMLPGVVFGMYASVFVSGNPHGGVMAPLVIVSGIVNFAFYTTLSLVVLSMYSRVQRRQ